MLLKMFRKFGAIANLPVGQVGLLGEIKIE